MSIILQKYLKLYRISCPSQLTTFRGEGYRVPKEELDNLDLEGGISHVIMDFSRLERLIKPNLAKSDLGLSDSAFSFYLMISMIMYGKMCNPYITHDKVLIGRLQMNDEIMSESDIQHAIMRGFHRVTTLGVIKALLKTLVDRGVMSRLADGCYIDSSMACAYEVCKYDLEMDRFDDNIEEFEKHAQYLEQIRLAN